MRRIRQFFTRMFITPERARSLIAKVISGLLLRAKANKSWDAVKAFPKWLRRLADFIDRYSSAELPEDQDALIAELVHDAITDATVDYLIERVSALDNGTAEVVTETPTGN